LFLSQLLFLLASQPPRLFFGQNLGALPEALTQRLKSVYSEN
jgi:hypothetical protein